MHQDEHRILRAIWHGLSLIGEGDVASAESQYLVATARRLLSYLLVRQEQLPAFSAEQQALLLGALNENAAAVDGDPQAVIDKANDRLSDLIRGGVAGQDARTRQAVRDLGWALVHPRERVRAGVERYLEPSPRGGPAPVRLDVDQVNAYLESRRPLQPTPKISALSYMPGGYSRETIMLTPDAAGPYAGEIVLRKAVNGDDVQRMAPEWSVLSFAFRRGLPAPEPLWFESDPSALGNIFFAVKRLHGRNSGDVFGSDTPVAAASFEQLAGMLARLHHLDASELTATPGWPMCTPQDILAGVEGLAQSSDDTLFQLLLQWLRENIPAQRGEPALLHGDVGFHNMLRDGDRITALLDWETSHLGDPAEELAYVRPSVEKFLPWETFLDHYVAAGGGRPSEDAMRFYTVYKDVWRASACLSMERAFLGAETPPLSQGVPAFIFGPMFLIDAARCAFDLDKSLLRT